MSDLEFQVVNARPGTENQRKFGIMATFGLNVIVDGTPIVSLSDFKLAKSREGKVYIASPFREYENSKGEKAKIYYAKLFPKERDGDSQKAIIEQVKRECENGGSSKTTQNNRSSNPPKTYSKPAQNKADW